ncbi:MAG: imidazole glycerol phosphate synthase subunit HisH [Gammaproteobacteria bacterium]|nr:MAG: imidazole glycerol phosphate synthase subunit HisH [Gammaproteobacteria bacterium]RKZ94551.1 MAG: imidazole glycerol phosphate synthase subunit HisH [Gammaproteobacteria bacterium]RKZ95661.1 MAG: imidazole glycerol phosphate synthase subunit HisH [Gammaproteobacteria bacterium]RLA00869.1 MAG: imidazole glycerol phosphate synthase subunit HisH [Gammaproteobacteria bacterium]
MRRVAVIDYGMGNLRSVSKALEAVGGNDVVVEVTSDPAKILAASHIVFPGVGAIRDCIAELKRLQLDDVIREAAASKPMLGICLGMQALLSHSEENDGTEGLNIISGNVRHFDIKLADNGEHLKVPHMGWNEVHQTSIHPLWHNIEQDSRFYFVHSYFVDPDDEAVIAAITAYPDNFSSAVHKDNIFAVQFHPEKSQHVGLQLLENFLNWDGQS